MAGVQDYLNRSFFPFRLILYINFQTGLQDLQDEEVLGFSGLLAGSHEL